MKRFRAELKAVGEAGHGTWKAVASAPSVDRDNEVVDAFAFEPLPATVPVHAEHFGEIIGSGRPYYEGETLYIDGTFASTPKAQVIRSLVREGHLRTMSVAFMTLQKRKGNPTHIEKAELLAVDWASIPSNRDALVLAAKALKTDEATLKAIAGSFEARQEDILDALVDANTDAIRAAYPDAQPGEYRWHLHIVATFDDRVVYRIGFDDDDALQVTYTADADAVTITGTPEPVGIDQVLTHSTIPKGGSRMSGNHNSSRAEEDELYLRAKRVKFAALIAIGKSEAAMAAAEKSASRELLTKQLAWAKAHLEQKAEIEQNMRMERSQPSAATLSPYELSGPVRVRWVEEDRDPDLPPLFRSTAPVHVQDFEAEPDDAPGFGAPAGTAVTYRPES